MIGLTKVKSRSQKVSMSNMGEIMEKAKSPTNNSPRLKMLISLFEKVE